MEICERTLETPIEYFEDVEVTCTNTPTSKALIIGKSLLNNPVRSTALSGQYHTVCIDYKVRITGWGASRRKQRENSGNHAANKYSIMRAISSHLLCKTIT